ncbi:YitT family protein [Thalassotalea sp. PLHSN55]|uniref:YitT family protein n=1 Tax=Thalassotalea sp. PLHSN55 TaxID=3435888 RepID=UPI003F84445D
MQTPLLPLIKNLLLITTGSAFLAFSMSFFLIPAQIATGGTPGMSILIHYISDVPVAAAMIIVNVPMLLAGFKFIDIGFALRTVFSIAVTSLLIALLPRYFDFIGVDNLILSALYGGICLGAGIGLILKGQASAGGTTIIAKIVSHYTPVKPAQAILALDMLVIIAIAIIYQNIELALWSLLSIYVTSKTIDKVLSGSPIQKIVHIVSDNAKGIGSGITQELGRSGSILNASNLAEDKNKKILFVVVGSREIPRLKNIIDQHDENALVIIMNASEMMGSSQLN